MRYDVHDDVLALAHREQVPQLFLPGFRVRQRGPQRGFRQDGAEAWRVVPLQECAAPYTGFDLPCQLLVGEPALGEERPCVLGSLQQTGKSADRVMPQAEGLSLQRHVAAILLAEL
ncbi:hypothetical protein DTL70_21505 [Streptomyces diacarni]|uniref:Uncharacterized protein n=1 Tax=Streptomyces diacarni TaxID=2800381 RepID=A0A367ERY4_9ACTN|nr:hypothetical protein DTL70_21505 [Streptomyces diacarni]